MRRQVRSAMASRAQRQIMSFFGLMQIAKSTFDRSVISEPKFSGLLPSRLQAMKIALSFI